MSSTSRQGDIEQPSSSSAEDHVNFNTVTAKEVEPTTPQIIAEPYYENTSFRPPQVLYVTYANQQPSTIERRPSLIILDNNADDNRDGEEDSRPLLWCAIIGFLFSWIPIIGFLTFCLNSNAPVRSQRAVFAHMACFVAGVVVFLNILILPAIFRPQ